MNKKIRSNKKAGHRNTKKKWIKPSIKEHPIQDIESPGFNEILLRFGDPGVSKG